MSSQAIAALATLDRAKERKVPWTEVAQIVSQGMEAEQGATGRRAFLTKATEVTGYSPNMLLRFVSVWKFLNQELATRRRSIAEVQDIGFSSLELIRRAWKVDQPVAEDLLNRVLNRQFTVRVLQRAVAHVQTGSPRYERFIIRSFGQHAEALVIDEMRKNMQKFFGPDAHEIYNNMRRAFGSGFDRVIVDAIVPIQRGKETIAVDGVEIKTGPSCVAPLRFMNNVVRECAWDSTFFRKSWLILVNPARAFARMHEDIKTLSIENLGIAVATVTQHSANIYIEKEPKEIAPSPDRRFIVLDAIKKGVEQYGNSFWDNLRK